MKLKCSLAYTPTHPGLPHSSSLKAWLLRLTPLATRGPPSAQSSFAWHERYSCQGGVRHHLERHYPFFIAPTNSCAKPAPSPGLRVSTLISGSPCRLPRPLLRTGSSRRYLCKSFPGCLSHDPVGLQGASACYVTSPAHRPSPRGSNWVGFPEPFRKETSCGTGFEIVAISYVQASCFVRHPGLPYRYAQKVAGQP